MNQEIQHYLLKFKTELGLLFFSFLTFITPIWGMVGLVAFSVFLDTCAGVYIARKFNNYQSDKLFNLVVKTFFYMTTILLAFLIDTYIFDKKLANIGYLSSKTVTMFWIYIECKSIDEKSQKLGNKPFHVVLTALIKRIKAWKSDLNEIKKSE
ncbi:phage holin family protein [Flavobacterium sp.]|uniref:phage holin family protein n=1 Tax=Flavobacterium sp. TaxID=239 RepID=UPI00261086C9|nr:phage holin family protein [Flavobacterium sp.]